MTNTRTCNPRVYLNNAATSFPKPAGLGEEVAAFLLKIPGHPGRSGGDSDHTQEDCRVELANLVKAENPSSLVLCKNATEALNIAIQGLEWRGEAVVTSAAEHNSVLRPLYLLEKLGKLKLEIVPCDSQGRVEPGLWRQAIDRLRPKLVVLNHASNVTGAVNPVTGLFEYASNRGCITLLDASQTLGLLDIDVSGAPIDMLAFTGHKYLLGPPGTGGLYVRPGVELAPVFVGGTGVRSDLKEMPQEMPGRLEPGTPAVPLFAGLLFSLRWQRQNQLLRDEMMEHFTRLERGLLEAGARVVKVEGERTPTLSFRLPGWEIGETGYILARSYDIQCRTGLHCAPLVHPYIGMSPGGSIRFSLSRFTTGGEIDYVLDTIGELMHAAG